MVIWIKFTHSIHFSSLIPKILMFTLTIFYLTTSDLSWSMDLTHHRFLCNIVLYSTGHYFHWYIHNWASFLIWPSGFILSTAISSFPLIFPSSTLDAFWPGVLIFRILSFCLSVLFMGFSWQEYCSSLPFPPPVDYILSELSTMTRPSWAALYSMVHGVKAPSPQQGCDPWRGLRAYSTVKRFTGRDRPVLHNSSYMIWDNYLTSMR